MRTLYSTFKASCCYIHKGTFLKLLCLYDTCHGTRLPPKITCYENRDLGDTIINNLAFGTPASGNPADLYPDQERPSTSCAISPHSPQQSHHAAQSIAHSASKPPRCLLYDAPEVSPVADIPPGRPALTYEISYIRVYSTQSMRFGMRRSGRLFSANSDASA
jgi:hypothetical protein